MTTDKATAVAYFTKFLASPHVRVNARGYAHSNQGYDLQLIKNGAVVFDIRVSKSPLTSTPYINFGDEQFDLTQEEYAAMLGQVVNRFPINEPADLDQYL